MKKTTTIFCLLLAATSTVAQRSKDAQLEDSIFSWKAVPALKVSSYTRAFTPAQLKHPELFAQWLQKSYIPVGALDFSYAVAEPNKKDETQPYGTGINAAMWRAMWDNAGTKAIKQPHSENPIYLLTNYIIDAEPVPMLTIPGRAVFTRRSPDIEKAFAGSSERRNQLVRQLKLENHPQIGKYIIQYYGCDGDGCQPRVAVYLAPNNKLPIRQLTRGEVLDMCEQAMTAEHQQKMGNRVDSETLLHCIANIQKLRNKYRGALNIPAELRDPNGIWVSTFKTYNDIFDTEDAKRLHRNIYGIYTYEDGILQKSKQDQPLWVCISWKPTDLNYMPYEREIHRSMTTHFNFDYVFDYFFRPESIKNQPYAILHEDLQKTHLAAYKKKKESKPAVTKQLAANIYFFEDFSGNSIGEKPQEWYVSSVGAPSVVAVPPGESGKWLKLEQFRAMPDYKNKPLPQNFSMEFDAATNKDFTENTGGALLLRIHNKILTPGGDYKDAQKQIFIDLDVKAGNTKFSQNPTGYTRLKTTYTGMNSAVRNADMLQYNNDFSNKKSKVHFTITKEGKKVRAFIDGKEIEALDKYGKAIPGFNELPDGAVLTSFYFENITNHSSKHLGIYITNIKIAKL
ncbi:hypothetical protein [Chitinophaga alhagiae]|uniref:hypothetical protein n=1 Tax=Chitinophaga alhagiae TaxID=2203219 RepID=UPI000E5BE9B7|nr:hypothetical protein [Chitinophaga alhagiae]